MAGHADFPDGASRPGDNLYTNSLVVLDGKTGELKWYYQAIGHDLRDWDLHLGPILTDFTIDGEETPVAVLSGKMGTVYVVNRDTHELIWKKDVGKHTPEAGFQDGIGTTLQGSKVTKAKADEDGPDRNAPFRRSRPGRRYPGWLGGVETPMAVSDGVIYVPVNNLCAVYLRQEQLHAGAELCDFATSSGEMLALDGATGDEIWKAEMRHPELRRRDGRQRRGHRRRLQRPDARLQQGGRQRGLDPAAPGRVQLDPGDRR